MSILNIAGYKFSPLNELNELKTALLSEATHLQLKGTVLLSPEGINISLAGLPSQVEIFKQFLQKDARFADISYRESYSETQPFQQLKVKLKKEIITLRQSQVSPVNKRAPSISPEEFKRLLDENSDITVLDTRNDYEIQFGTFKGAVNLHLDHFTDLPNAIDTLNRDKPMVMFCTGGIRCEKAALYMMNQGFSDIRQLEGGILNYFAKVGADHYDGGCFVFDERIALDPQLRAVDLLE